MTFCLLFDEILTHSAHPVNRTMGVSTTAPNLKEANQVFDLKNNFSVYFKLQSPSLWILKTKTAHQPQALNGIVY